MDPEQIPLRELHFPEAIGWWPLAPGWWILAGIALLGLLFLLRHWARLWSRGAARRFAMRQLADIVRDYERQKNAVTFGSRVSELLRRTMLAYAPRTDVAGLTGEQWLQWLDRDLSEPVFSKGPGRQLLELPYRDPDAGQDVRDLEQFVAAVRHRMATPVGGQR